MIKLPSFSDFNVTRQEFTLSNGVRVVLFERPKTPISMQVVFYSGSRFDPVGKEGLSHFTEHMVAAGTKKFPTKDSLAMFIENMGGSFAASTGLSSFNIFLSVVEPEDFPNAVLLLNEMLNNSLFDPKVIETERGSIFRELDSKESSPNKYLGEVSRRIFLQNTLCGRSTIGSKETIPAITKEDIISYYDAMLSSGRVVLVLSGGISMDAVVSALESGFTVRKSNPFVVGGDLPTIRNKPVEIKSYTTNDLINLDFGFRVCSHYNDDTVPLVLLGSILGGGRASTLMKKLRYEKGLVYGVSAGYGGSVDFGTFSIDTEVSKAHLQEAFDIITTELEKLVSTGVSEEELSFVKNRSIKSKKGSMQTSSSWVSFHAFDELVGNANRLTLPEYLIRVNEVTLEDIQKVAKEYLRKDSWYLAMCGDVKESDVVISY